VKLLLTSAGVKNQSIRDAIVELAGKPIEECDTLYIPTGGYPMGGPYGVWRSTAGVGRAPLVEAGWKSVGVLELSVLTSLGEQYWRPQFDVIDVLLVGGGDAVFMSYWMKQSGVAELLPSMNAVYVGLSGGSMVLTPRIGDEFMEWTPPTGHDETLGIVDFSIFPHVDHPEMPENSMAEAEKWAATLGNPSYALDDQSAIKVVDGNVQVITEGHWQFFD
jgi:dipeptidase E